MSDIGAQSPSNEHIDRLASILLTYHFYEKELGMHFFTCLHGGCIHALDWVLTVKGMKVMYRACLIFALRCML